MLDLSSVQDSLAILFLSTQLLFSKILVRTRDADAEIYEKVEWNNRVSEIKKTGFKCRFFLLVELTRLIRKLAYLLYPDNVLQNQQSRLLQLQHLSIHQF